MKTIKKPVDLTDLCARAVKLHRELKAIEDQLKPLKEELVLHACNDEASQVETKSGGKSWIHGDGLGHSVRVSFPADSYPMISEADETLLKGLRSVARKCFTQLFAETKVYVPVTNFKVHAHELLGGKEALQVIGLAAKENAPKVSFVLEGGQ